MPKKNIEIVFIKETIFPEYLTAAKGKKVIFLIQNNQGRSILKYAVFFSFHLNGLLLRFQF